MPPQQNQFQTGFAGGGGNPFAFANAPGRQENVPSFLKEKADQNKDQNTVKLEDLMNFKANNFTLGPSKPAANNGFNQSQGSGSSKGNNPFEKSGSTGNSK